MQEHYKFFKLNNEIFSYLKKHVFKERYTFYKLLGISIISSGIVILQPLFMQKLIDTAFIPKDLDMLYFWATIILSVGIFGIFINAYTQYSYTDLSTKLLFNLRADIFEMIFYKQKRFFQKYPTGDTLSRLQGDISQIQRFGTDSIFALNSAILGMIGAFFIMFSFDTSLTLFCLILLPIEFLALKPFFKKMYDKTQQVRQINAKLGNFMIESIKFALFFKIFETIKIKKEQLKSLQGDNKSKILEQQKLQILFTSIPVFIALLGRAFIVFWGGYKVVNSQIQVGEFIAFLTYFGMILSPVQTILGVLNNLPKIQVSFNRLSIFLNEKNNNNTKKIDSLENPKIVFKNFFFKYENQKELLQDVNLSINYKEKIIIKGENGSGKSTLTQILLKLINYTQGSIKIDNIELKEIPEKTIYKTIGLVEQHPIIFTSTLRDNLSLYDKNLSDEILIEALDKVGLKTWFETLTLKLDTILFDEGTNLSGGQKQRISIARLILRKPKIIILDEFTSSLDEKFSQDIEFIIDTLFKNHTRIIISHKKHKVDDNAYEIVNNKLIKIEKKYE